MPRLLKYCHQLLFLSVLLAHAGCAWLVKDHDELSFQYGNFCGKGHPYSPKQFDEYQFLLSLKPVDDLDLACKVHDICYLQNGEQKTECDKVLQQDVEHLLLNGEFSGCEEQCRSVAYKIWYFSFSRVGSVGAGYGISGFFRTLSVTPVAFFDIFNVNGGSYITSYCSGFCNCPVLREKYTSMMGEIRFD